MPILTKEGCILNSQMQVDRPAISMFWNALVTSPWYVFPICFLTWTFGFLLGLEASMKPSMVWSPKKLFSITFLFLARVECQKSRSLSPYAAVKERLLCRLIRERKRQWRKCCLVMTALLTQSPRGFISSKCFKGSKTKRSSQFRLRWI